MSMYKDAGGFCARNDSSVLVRSHRGSPTRPRPRGAGKTLEKEYEGEAAPKPPACEGRKQNENQSDESLRGRPGEGPAVLHRSTGLRQEDGFQSGPVSLA